MAMFVHLTPSSGVPRIRKNGIRRSRRAAHARQACVFAMPVTPNFYVSHQWLRELRRRSDEGMVGVYFRIPDDTKVWLGRYNQAHRPMTAAEAVNACLTAGNAEGWEVMIPRRIARKEIRRFKSLPQVVGWRFYPESKGKRPCPCSFCSRGDRGRRRIRSRLGGSPSPPAGE